MLNFIQHDTSSFKIIIVRMERQFLIFILKIRTTLNNCMKILAIPDNRLNYLDKNVKEITCNILYFTRILYRFYYNNLIYYY